MSRRRIGLAITATVLVVAGTGVIAMTSASAATTGQITGYGGKCVDVAAAGTANGTQVQLYTCNGTAAQQWTVGDDGTIRALGKCLDVNAASTANGTKIQIWDCNGTSAQQWSKQSDGTLRSLGKCLDATGPSSADGTKLQLWDCFASANQQWTLPGGTTNPPTSTPPNNPNNPDLGPNVSVFDPSMSQATIQSRLNTVFNQQVSNQFGNARFALLFKPGTYNVNVNVGFFTQVAGLGMSPDSVVINGAVHAEADWWPDGSQNATQNFWRSAENLSVTPTGGLDRWAVSQAAPYRRMHVRGNLALSDGGWSSGGWISDSKIDGQIQSGSQQQWITRNSQIGSWSGSNWNQVFVGVQGAPANSFPSPPYTTVGTTPVVREKPFLYVDSAGAYQVFVPSLRSNSSGNSWSTGTTAGSSLPISQFYIVKAGATAASINAALAAGQNLLFTPGVYNVSDTIRITRPDTVVLGLGLATIVPQNGVTAMTVADVDGVKVAGILFDAGTTNSQVLMEVGPSGSAADHSANPTSLHDVFFRIGGSIAGKATVSLRVNSNHVIGDHMWIWRADHGNGGTVGWNTNTAANGLVVNGNNVTMYGLFVEHYQQYQTIWNGNGGRTYFYQNEIPYDVPNQASWSSGGGAQGWAAYKVGNSVTSHEAWGLGSYCYFSTNPSVVLGHSFEVPVTTNVKFHNMVTVSLGGTGTIAHVINDTGAAVNSGHQVTNLVSGP
ncbi:ricin-type beta-trefoil lectin domain protein [Dactylosporangium aurantiacum]|uniref:ricin-type beta-trefoil lectin domain protein n=1 Tax=Dactylosporangium aurantiacum TaxID=35754 RepID=UPI0021B457F7|nr:ricin-type beta-trefoil lectin domain protein [Dactylosporangium aurantiacum]MDG6104057.1 ricin-type beta-trefoil lectin domain protein [Dactylosporangium aurantiacum]